MAPAGPSSPAKVIDLQADPGRQAVAHLPRGRRTAVVADRNCHARPLFGSARPTRMPVRPALRDCYAGRVRAGAAGRDEASLAFDRNSKSARGSALVWLCACLLPALGACGGSIPAWQGGADGRARCSLEASSRLDDRIPLELAPGSDVVLALDTSESTRIAMPGYADGKPIAERMRVAPGQTRLAAEVDLACALLRKARRANARVGVVVFSGYPQGNGGFRTEDALRWLAVTDDWRSVAATLDVVFAEGGAGGTNYAAALLTSLVALEDPRRERRIVLITDGIPTLPQLPATATDELDWEVAFQAAKRLEAEGVRLDILAVGDMARSPSFGMVKAVSLTGGGTTLGFHDLPR